jgi:hypothetical protein
MVGVRSLAPTPPRGVRRRYFLALMVGALEFTALAPPRGRHRCFLALMVGALGSPAPAPPRGGPLLMFLSVDGGPSWIYCSDTSQGARH